MDESPRLTLIRLAVASISSGCTATELAGLEHHDALLRPGLQALLGNQSARDLQVLAYWGIVHPSVPYRRRLKRHRVTHSRSDDDDVCGRGQVWCRSIVEQRITSDPLQPVRKRLTRFLGETCPVAIDVWECMIAHVEDCGGACGGHSAGRCRFDLPHDGSKLLIC